MIESDAPNKIPTARPSYYGLGLGIDAESILPELADRIEDNLVRMIEDRSEKLESALNAYEKRASHLDHQIESNWKDIIFDEFASIQPKDLLDEMIQHIGDKAWQNTLQRSFLSNFIKHQPQYDPHSCLVSSGSARTALAILGFHCGLNEVVIADLAWSYEHCFEKTHVVPLTDSLDLDADAFIEKLIQLRRDNPDWPTHGAVVISNPHNATGQIFNEAAIRKLITFCLQNNITIVDDLAYQNIAPVNTLPEIKTSRQIAEELVQIGILDSAQTERLVTVHSLSKTDSFAGARLAVVEIRDAELRQRFQDVIAHIQPNLAAIYLSYLFYRAHRQDTRSYWQLRNILFKERMEAMHSAVDNLPVARNPFKLTISPPMGSMYPLLRIERLPSGLSLDWLASSLARQGIGLLPLSTFARTAKGFENGRKTFRLTLGGKDNAETLKGKTRRLLIDLNRLIAEQEARYNRRKVHTLSPSSHHNRDISLARDWDEVCAKITHHCDSARVSFNGNTTQTLKSGRLRQEFFQYHLPQRLEIFKTRLLDRATIHDELMVKASALKNDWLTERLAGEFYKDSLARRQEQFKLRSYDRTVHPTQAYSIQTEMALDNLIQALIKNQPLSPGSIETAARALVDEFLGQNVSISALDESHEILLDLDALIAAEDYAELFTENASINTLLSFWSDWDGSKRPSGQGHRLIGIVVMENVRRMSNLLNLLRHADPGVDIAPDLLAEINQIPEQNQQFYNLLNTITQLTHQLEQRYRSILPFSLNTTPIQRLATSLNLRRDPAKVLWQHNDRYERKMRELRQQRRHMLERYFGLNKQLRKQLHALIPDILENRTSETLLREVVGYRDLLQRTLITPRIHQQMMVKRDQFAIDTTVFNLDEINSIAGQYGNPGMILALQVSMASEPDALISLDRKFRTQADQMHRNLPDVEVPSIWLIPLFEGIETVEGIPAYLDRMWDYAIQSRNASQNPQERFAEIFSEVFIAGSDLSQQVSQATSAHLYRTAKFEIQTWLAQHGVVEDVRLKLGSGEPMQRQGGYYAPYAGKPAVLLTPDSNRRFARNIPAAARKSTEYAVTPLLGIWQGRDLRTYQGNVSERLRYLPVSEFTSLQYHVHQSQMAHRDDLIRAAETLSESRLGSQSRNLQELERLTIGTSDELYQSFLEEITKNFRLVLYGRKEDVVGIHAASYFIGRSLPQLRDRPTSRKSSGSGREQGRQILANIAEIIPLSEQGSLLRAIAHNQSQTIVLGINQLTTGLFRAIERFAQKNIAASGRTRTIAERLLPHLPVYEILTTLRHYQDVDGEFFGRIETAFPAGNSALLAMIEDKNAMQRYLPLFQQELLRRHGLDVIDFFTNGVFIPDLLPTLRPELAVLLQEDLFNTDIDVMLANVDGKIDPAWRAETAQLLQIREKIRSWRAVIWDLIGDSIFQRVQSFSELANALHSLSSSQTAGALTGAARSTRFSPTMANFFRTAQADDEMRRFLLGTMEYLNTFVEGNIEVPISIIRAINDVERLAQIEESALPPEKQELLRFCILQIVRLTGESG